MIRRGLTLLVLIGFCCTVFASSRFVNATQDEVYAVLTPVHEAKLSSEMTGKITRFFFLPGEHFQKGDTLVAFDCRHLIFQAQKIKAVMKATSANLNSHLALKKMNSISEVELKTAESEHEKAEAEYAAIQHQMTQCKLIAPYAGHVVLNAAKENEVVKVDDPVIDVVNNDSLEVKLFVPSRWLRAIKVGTPFKLKLDEVNSAKPFDCQITKIVRRIDPASQSLLVYGKITDKGKADLFSGMSGKAIFKLNMAG